MYVRQRRSSHPRACCGRVCHSRKLPTVSVYVRSLHTTFPKTWRKVIFRTDSRAPLLVTRESADGGCRSLRCVEPLGVLEFRCAESMLVEKHLALERHVTNG